MSWNTCEYYGCESYTARPDGKHCETHRREVLKEGQQMKKQSVKFKVKLSAPQKPKKPVKKVSDKRKELNKEYFKLVEQFKYDNPHCKAKVNIYCTGKTDDPHHTRGRNKYLLDTTTWLPVCRSCHSYIEAHPQEAKEKGWSESRLQTLKQTI